jgi:hypothetical protein
MINYIEKGNSLHDFLVSQQCYLEERDGVWICNKSDEEVNTLIASYNPWSKEKAAKFAEIDADFQHSIDSLTDGWPEGEIKTWERQEKEALALQSNPAAPTPFLATVANQRGITVAELATRVIRDSIAFSNASAYYVGLRHKARQLVQAFPDAGDYHRLPELWSIKFKE